ncbi:amino acid ABC transporter permease [Facklamia sp. DSM 111018]|uniref:Amino acid ABC transporter permease n=1 Tax=Facklamia lactis TaxID=2749967 RepID=A0ABS0LSL8_9LACT|nr:amino acid ABC transporter permease [Facklamia lactis]MBG9981364.1 amino acid ABC transporter permease [Facklamia lactis]MBG9987160.1 amino acid ABC transporter permease [Facklamia lactis]
MNFIQAFSLNNIRFLLQGLWVTLQIAGVSIFLSIILGILFAILRYKNIPIFSKILALIIDTIRNLPLLLIIFFTYFALPQLGIQFNLFWSATAALTIFESAMISEIIRGGLIALPKGQTEAGIASGLTHNQVMFHILLPQAWRQTLPSVVSQLISLIKDTSLATIISLPELTHNAKIIYGQNTQHVLPMFIALACLYFIVCFALSRLSKHLSKHLSKRRMKLA